MYPSRAASTVDIEAPRGQETCTCVVRRYEGQIGTMAMWGTCGVHVGMWPCAGTWALHIMRSVGMQTSVNSAADMLGTCGRE